MTTTTFTPAESMWLLETIDGILDDGHLKDRVLRKLFGAEPEGVVTVYRVHSTRFPWCFGGAFSASARAEQRAADIADRYATVKALRVPRAALVAIEINTSPALPGDPSTAAPVPNENNNAPPRSLEKTRDEAKEDQLV